MDDDTALIVATVHDYFDGWFDGDASRMERALHRDLVKRSSDRDHGSALSFVTAEQHRVSTRPVRAVLRVSPPGADPRWLEDCQRTLVYAVGAIDPASAVDAAPGLPVPGSPISDIMSRCEEEGAGEGLP